jgi:LPS export ABC transporter protein LptC
MDPPPNQVIEDFRLTETNEGRTFFDLQAERAFVYEDSHRIEVVRPRVRFYDSDRRLTSILTADAGRVDTRSSNLTARGAVRVVTRDSTSLHTDSLVWVNAQRQVMTDADVRMEGPTGTIAGRGLVSDAELKRIDIRQTIQATTR